MSRKLRIQYEGARYHIINRGNYRSDVFASKGASAAFETALFEAAQYYAWMIHAYVIMRNHFHLAVETPRPNLTEGMHWLQSTFAMRFNRLRKQHGHLFQGRYKAIILEDAVALARVVDYIHLNPVRASVVTAENVASYPGCSLYRLKRNMRVEYMGAAAWLEARGGWTDNAPGIASYEKHLIKLGQDEELQKCEGISCGKMSRGWAIGTFGWRRALAEQYSQKAFSVGMEREDIREIKAAHWSKCLKQGLLESGKHEKDLITRPLYQPWKIALASQLRQKGGASISWIGEHLHLGKPASIRSYLCRFNNNQMKMNSQ